MMKTVKAKIAAEQTKKFVRPLVSLFYKLLRGTPFYAPNLRKSDFTAQNFEKGKLPPNPHVVVTQSASGMCTSVCNMKGKLLDLLDGRVFDTSGIKRCAAMKLGSAARSFAKANGSLHTIRIKHGPKKGTHTGYILGKFEDFYVGFVAKDGTWAWGLDTVTLPNNRNQDRTFELVK